jgi:Ras family protein T1
MARIHKLNDKVPVIFVGNKVDLRSSSADTEMTNILNHYFLDYNQLQMGIECSPKVYLNLIDVIVSAQRTVLYPIAPLYDSINKQLKPDYQRALLRIFRICDTDGDGIMDDKDLIDLQRNVFKHELSK